MDFRRHRRPFLARSRASACVRARALRALSPPGAGDFLVAARSEAATLPDQAKVVLDKEVAWGDVAQLALIELALNRCAVQKRNASPRPDAQLDGGDAGDLERACEVVKIEVARGEVLL